MILVTATIAATGTPKFACDKRTVLKMRHQPSVDAAFCHFNAQLSRVVNRRKIQPYEP